MTDKPTLGVDELTRRPPICMSCEFNDCAECEEWTEFRRCCCGELAQGCKPGCVYPEGHDRDCLDEQDVAEERLRSRDYESWANL